LPNRQTPTSSTGQFIAMETKLLLTACLSAGALWVVASAARGAMPPLLPPPDPQQSILQLSATDQWLTAFNRIETQSGHSGNDKLTAIKSLVQQARTSGDQRLLGQALHALDQLEQSDTEVQLQRADIEQALHRFDAALEELRQVVRREPDNVNAWMMQAAALNVQGDYRAALFACRQVLTRVSPLLSASCSSSVLARQGQAQRAYDLLEQLYLQTAPAATDHEILHQAEISLAEIAEQLGDPRAAQWWQRAQVSAPQDLYTRIGAARNALRRGDYAEVIRLSENSENIDALLVLRAQALEHQDAAEAAPLRALLADRVALAQARGDTLHARDQATILLDLMHQPEDALRLAQMNWTNQREPEDTLLLLRAAQAAGRADVFDDTWQWLRRWNQTHALYPVAMREVAP
jgi:tetratricopeptide (TPR) repeat protein